jgi:hypothetical protein
VDGAEEKVLLVGVLLTRGGGHVGTHVSMQVYVPGGSWDAVLLTLHAMLDAWG